MRTLWPADHRGWQTSSALSCVGNSAVAHEWVVWRVVGAVVGSLVATRRGPPLRAALDRLRPPRGRRCHDRNGPAPPQCDVSQAALDCGRMRRQVSIDHRWEQPGTLQVYQRALVAQQVLPMGAAISAALAVVAAGAVVASSARHPGTAGTVGGRINRQHESPPDPAARRR